MKTEQFCFSSVLSARPGTDIRRLIIATLTLLIVGAPQISWAEDGLDESESLGDLETPPELRWNPSYERVRWWQYAATPVLGLGGVSLRFLGPEPPDNWSEPNDVDLAITEAITPTTQGPRSTWKTISDIGYFGAMAYRALEDIAWVGAIKGSWDVSWQMLWIDLQVFSAVGGTLWTSQLFLGRQRPVVEGCTNPEIAGNRCGEGTNSRRRSFFAGHPAVTVAVAGTTCSHHSHLDIYPGIGGAIACGVAVTNAAMVSVSRVVAGEHYVSDLLVGMGVGAAAGWGIPLLLHYTRDPDDTALETPLVLPFSDETGTGLALSGLW